MKITFTLLKAPAKVALQQGQKSFDEQGGSIGRADGNLWTLPDPDKFLSSKHCLISYAQQQFFVTDTSTNGLFLNGASLPIGRNNKVAIAEGDTLDLGEYRLRIGIEAGSNASASPFGSDFAAPPAEFAGGSEWGSLDAPGILDPAFGAAATPAFTPSHNPDPFAPLAAPPAPGKSPFGSQGDPFNKGLEGFGPDPFGADPFSKSADAFAKPMDPFAKPADPFAQASNPFAPAANPFAKTDDPFAPQGDPFALTGDPFAKSADPFAKSADPFGSPKAPADYGFTQGEQGSPLSQSISLPPLTSDKKGIPDDFWNSLGGPEGADPFGSAAKPPAAPPPVPVSTPVATPPIPDDFFAKALGVAVPSAAPSAASPGPAHDPLAGFAPLDAALTPSAKPSVEVPPPVAVLAQPPVATFTPELKTPIPAVAETPITAVPIPPTIAPPVIATPIISAPRADYPTPVSTAAATVSSEAQVLAAALGLSGKITAAQAEILPELIGAITRESLSGLLQILRARSSIKNEFRITVTTIQATENNPIKFATDVDDALDLLFVRQSKGYKPALESVRDGFESVMDHQVAMLAGIRAAFTALLGRFDPVTLENQFERQGKTGGLIPGMKGAKCWSAYDDFYRELIGNFENSFQNLFGDDFVQAYEEQLRKLAIARKLDSRHS